jgi:hypothetical protein
VRLAAALLVAAACVGGGSDTLPPAETLVRDGAHPSETRNGDLDGDGSPELVIVSVSDAKSQFGLPTPYLEVFALREGEWRRVFDATGHAPAGEGAPDVMLQPASEGFASPQTVEVLELVDFAGDGSMEIVAAISNVGATAGPLDLWIISIKAQLRTEYYVRTERGGSVGVDDGRVTLEFGVYRRKDPGCCPSILERRTIGYDPESASIVTLDRERQRVETG